MTRCRSGRFSKKAPLQTSSRHAASSAGGRSLRSAGGGPDRSAWAGDLRAVENEKRAAEQEDLTDDRAPLHPMRVYGELAQVLDRDAVVIGDGGDFVSFAGRMIDTHEPGCWMDPGPYGCLGSGPGAALAAKLAHPERQVCLLLGDGAGGFRETAEAITVGPYPYSMAVADFDGDEAPDIGVAQQSATEAYSDGVGLLFNRLPQRADTNGSNRVDGFDIAADSPHNIVASAATAHQNSSLLQHAVTRQMSVSVVVMFEVIDIKNEQCHPAVLSFFVLDYLSGKFPDITPIFQPRQVIFCCQSLQLSYLCGGC